jgi:hypothetical protein
MPKLPAGEGQQARSSRITKCAVPSGATPARIRKEWRWEVWHIAQGWRFASGG